MPARLDRPASKYDLRLYDEDVDFIRPILARRNSDLTEFMRDLLRRAANVHRKELGLPER